MLLTNSIIQTKNELIFLNSFARREFNELMNKIMSHMLEDLSTITGLDPQEIFDDYVDRNDTNIFIEILKDEGSYTTEDEMRDHKSLVMHQYECMNLYKKMKEEGRM